MIAIEIESVSMNIKSEDRVCLGNSCEKEKESYDLRKLTCPIVSLLILLSLAINLNVFCVS